MIKKTFLIIAILLSTIIATACQSSRQSTTCQTTYEWQDLNQKDCDKTFPNNCICKEKNLLGQCLACGCKSPHYCN